MVNLVGTNQNVAGVHSDQNSMGSPGVYLETYKSGRGYGRETVYKTQTPGTFTKYQARILQLLEEAHTPDDNEKPGF